MTDDNGQKRSLHWHCLDHENSSQCSSECYLQKTFTLFGKKYVLQIIRLLLLNEHLRFNEIVEKISGSPKTITDRLRELEMFGLVNRQQFNEMPIRVEYSLTELGKQLDTVFEQMSSWSRSMLSL
ncbi:MAG: winged helix-turn-helix transcriptional regulator [Candidatus Odinarchaeota archaeon]